MIESSVKRGIVAVTVLLAVVALASFASSSAWATPAQDGLRQTVPSPEPPPEATPQPPPQSIVLPPQRSGQDYSFVYVPLPPVDYPPPAGCAIYNPFRIEAYLGTKLVYPEDFDPPLEICVSYSADQADEAGGADNLSVVYWDQEPKLWIPLDNWRHAPAISQICGDIAFLPANNILALTCIIGPTAVPVTGYGAASSEPMAALLALALLGAALLATRLRQRASDD